MCFSGGFKVKSAAFTNILEDIIEGEEGECKLDESSVKLDLRRFEIKTLRLVVE